MVRLMTSSKELNRMSLVLRASTSTFPVKLKPAESKQNKICPESPYALRLFFLKLTGWR